MHGLFITANTASDLISGSSWVRDHGIAIIIILSIGYLTRTFGGLLIRRLIRQAMHHRPFPTPSDRKKRIQTLNSISGTSLNIVVAIASVLMIINEFGVNTSPLLASAGFISLTLGFGAQALIRDFMAGLFITAENQYRVGDIVEIQTAVNRIRGTVEHVTTRTTVLRDDFGHTHHIPNGAIVTSTNTTIDYSFINEPLTVERSTNLEQLAHVIKHIGDELAAMPEFEQTFRQPLSLGKTTELADTSITVRLHAKIAPGDHELLRSELLNRLNKALKQHKIALATHADQ